MTHWDKIYKNYKKSGKAWSTLSENIHPLFKQFLNKSHLKNKYVLDIGCGSGKYLKFLQQQNLKTDGIDSSKTSIKMTKELLGNNSKIKLANMFKYSITKNKYDLIISISTIHHGTKSEIKSLINKVYSALIKGGKIFITLPDYKSWKISNEYNNYKEIYPGTFIPSSGPEKGLPHSFYTKAETKKLFSKFKNTKIKIDNIGRQIIQAQK